MEQRHQPSNYSNSKTSHFSDQKSISIFHFSHFALLKSDFNYDGNSENIQWKYNKNIQLKTITQFTSNMAGKLISLQTIDKIPTLVCQVKHFMFHRLCVDKHQNKLSFSQTIIEIMKTKQLFGCLNVDYSHNTLPSSVLL